MMEVYIRHLKDQTIGIVDGRQFDRWYNDTECDLFLNSLKRFALAANIELRFLESWEEDDG